MQKIPLIISCPTSEGLQQAREAVLRNSPANEITRELPIIDGFAAEVDFAALERLDLASEVLVAPDREVQLGPEPSSGDPRLMLDSAAGTLHVQEVWDQGYLGRGIGIAIIDTGIAPHPDLATRVVAFHDVINERTQMYDDHGHGTHVAGIAAGNGSESNGSLKGIAPEATLIGVKVLNEKGRGKTSEIVDGIQWAVDNRQRYNIRAMNISIGGEPFIGSNWDPMARAVNKAVNKGLFIAVAAGNSGPEPKTVESPGIAPNACTVGNLDENWTPDRSDDAIARSSSRGPTKHDEHAKPDVCAPGTWIRSCDFDHGYVSMSGTSMASPMVAGAAALLIQARPDLPPGSVKKALMDTAAPLGTEPATAQGRGMIDPPRALAAIKATRHE